MAEKPILFSTDMVKAILAGRKNMTRRLRGLQDINENPDEWELVDIAKDDALPTHRTFKRLGLEVYRFIKLPWQVEDILWVRETWCRISDYADVDPEVGLFDGYIYRAEWRTSEHPKWHPSIYMPRDAARLFLRVKDVRVERLQSITSKQIEDEGTNLEMLNTGCECRYAFSQLWDSINGKKYPWEANPWVWVIGFEREAANNAS